MNIGEALCGPQECGTKEYREPSILETLTRKKKGLEESLARVDEALVALQENPQVTKVLELIAKAR